MVRMLFFSNIHFMLFSIILHIDLANNIFR